MCARSATTAMCAKLAARAVEQFRVNTVVEPMSKFRELASSYRSRAEQVRRRARQQPDLRDALLEIARGWDELAEVTAREAAYLDRVCPTTL